MEKRIFFLTIFFLFFGITHSQTIKDDENIDSTDIVIKGDDLKNFTSNNIVELLNGLFVSAFKTIPNVNDYLFIVDGFVLNDINTISIEDIEEIRFSYNNASVDVTPFSRVGIFLIKTKKTTSAIKGGWNFNSKLGVSFKKDKRFITNISTGGFATEERSFPNKNGFLNFNHISYQLNKKKINLYLSSRFNAQSYPSEGEVLERTDYQLFSLIKAKSESKETLASFFGTLEYRPTNNLNLKLNISYSNFKKNSTFYYDDYYKGSNFLFQKIENTDNKRKLNVLNVSLKSKFHFLNYFNNEISLELGNSGYATISNIKKISNSSGGSGTITTAVDNEYFTKKSSLKGMLLLSNLLRAKFDILTKFQAEFFFKVTIFNPNYSFYDSIITPGRTPSTFYSTIKNSYDNTLIKLFDPSIKLKYKNFFLVRIGLNYIPYTSINPFTGSSYNWTEKNSYYSSTINLFKIFNRKPNYDLFNFNFNYFNFPNNSTKYQFLTSVYNNEEPVESYLNEEQHPWHSPDTQDLDWKVLRNKVLSFQLNRTFFHKKLVVNAFVSNEKIRKLRLVRYRISLPPSNYISIQDYGDEIQKKIGIQFSGQILKTKTTNYSTVFNILFPEAEYDEITKADSLNAYQSTARLGWYNNFRFKKFYFQVKSLLELSHKYYEFNTSTSVFEMNKANDFIISNFAVGYNFNENKKGQMIKNISLSISANNILQSQSISNKYSFPKYAGIGASFNF